MLTDTFNGDNAKLIDSIEALLDLDAQGALVPHGVGGHARKMLASAAVRLARQPAALGKQEAVTDERRQAARDAVAAALGDAYDCMRVWEAWSVGTMSQDDFQLVADDESRIAEIADAAIDALYAAPLATEASKPAPSVEQDERGENHTCQTCKGSGVVDDGEITGSGGIEYENGPIKCVKDCPDCAASTSANVAPLGVLSATHTGFEFKPAADAPVIPYAGMNVYASTSANVAPEGFTLVPIEPTNAMTFIGQKHRYDSAWSIGAIYREMISSAPVVPSANVAQGAEMHICGECDRQFRAAPPVQTAPTDDVLMQAIADTAARGHVWASRALSNFRAAVREAAKSPNDA